MCDFNISIHALREEGDVKAKDSGNTILQFLSTPSARRATVEHFRFRNAILFLSTPSARRATAGALKDTLEKYGTAGDKEKGATT